MKNIVWIASYPKSGNTWARMLLNSLLHEAAYADALDSNIKIKGSDVTKDLYNKVLSLDISSAEFLRNRSSYIEQLSSAFRHRRLYLKTHNVNGLVNRNVQFPHNCTLAVVLVIRNVFDAVCSAMNHFDYDAHQAMELFSNKSSMLKEGTKTFETTISDWGIFNYSWLGVNGKLPIFVMRYEDLVIKPFSTLQRLSVFLGQEKSERDLISAVSANDFKNIQQAESKFGFSEAPMGKKFFNKGEVGYFKDHLSVEQILALANKFDRELKAFGYHFNRDSYEVEVRPIKHEFPVK